MRTRSERFLFVGSVLAVFALAGAIGFKVVTDGNRDAAVAKLKQSLDFQKRARTDTTGKQDVSPSVKRPSDPSNSVARFAQIFERANHCPDSHKWEDAFKKPPQEWTDAEWEQVRAELAGIQDLIRAIRELAEQGGPPADLDLSKGFETDMSHLAKLRDLARLLSLDAWTQARAGNSEVAVQDLLAVMRLGDCLLDEPFVISQLVRISMDRRAYDAARMAFPPGSLTSAQARSLMGYAGQSDHREALTDGLCGDGECFLLEFERVRQGGAADVLLGGGVSITYRDTFSVTGNDLERLLAAVYQGDHRAALVGAYGMTLAAPWRNMDETTFANLLPAIVDASRLPYYQALPLMQQIVQDAESLPSTRIVSHEVLPTLARSIGAQAQAEAMLDLMRIGLSVDQYYAENGSYPSSLSTVASELGGSIPVDPFTGEPYLYRASETGYSLYSVSHNLVDDGGRDDPNHGDFVWRTQQNTAPKSVVSPDKRVKTIAMR